MYFHRNGCRRMPNKDRYEEGSQNYKKGWEIRFTANNEAEAAELSKLLGDAGFKHGKFYSKNNAQIIVPLYGREASEKFSELLARVARIQTKAGEGGS